MPKISNNDITIYHADIRKNYKVEIFYNKDLSFYAKIVDDFKEVARHLDDKVLKELGISNYRKNMKSDYEQVISDSTEGGCLVKVKKALTYLVDKAVQKKNVIIVFYNSEKETQYGNFQHNDKHPQIGIQFGLTYAVETCVGDKKIYNVYRKWKGMRDEENVDRSEIHLWNKAC